MTLSNHRKTVDVTCTAGNDLLVVVLGRNKVAVAQRAEGHQLTYLCVLAMSSRTW